MIAINTLWKHKQLGYKARVTDLKGRSVRYKREFDCIPDNRYKSGTRKVERDTVEFRLSETEFLRAYECD